MSLGGTGDLGGKGKPRESMASGPAGGIFGSGSTASQFLLWAVASGIAQALLTPLLQVIQNGAWVTALDDSGGIYHTPLSPEILADMVVRGFAAEGDAANEAALSGVNSGDFTRLHNNAGEPPGLEMLLQAYRRGFIPADSGSPTEPGLKQGIATSRVYNYWFDVIRQLGITPVSAADAVEAVLRNQLDKTAGIELAFANGLGQPGPVNVGAMREAGTAEAFQLLLDTAGRPPSPGELIELARRGLIPVGSPSDPADPNRISLVQGIFEGDTKDKWVRQYIELMTYVPPPRSIATLQSHGVITPAQAAQYYEWNGLPPALAEIYTKSATAQRISAAKSVTEANVLKLYGGRLIDSGQATAMLLDLGYAGQDVTYLLRLTDFDEAFKAYTSAVTRVHSLYTARKITRASAVAALAELDVPADSQTRLLAEWDTETATNIKTLTTSEICDAYVYLNVPAAECLAMLADIGYDPYDAWIVLGVRAHGPVGAAPPKGAASGQGQPTTG